MLFREFWTFINFILLAVPPPRQLLRKHFEQVLRTQCSAIIPLHLRDEARRCTSGLCLLKAEGRYQRSVLYSKL